MKSLSDLQLPSPPRAAFRLAELCGDPDADVREIEEVISTDAALSARLLRVANSPYYGQQREISTLSRAVVVLGAEHVKVVALGFHLAELAKAWRDLPMDLMAYWQGNVLRACLARRIASLGSASASECQAEAFLVGLLQDYAVPLIAGEVGTEYSGWLGGGGLFTRESMLAPEEQLVGESHAGLAGRICDQWSFPPQLAYAIRRHHEAPQSERFSDRASILWQIGYFVGAVPFNEDRRTALVSVSLRHLAFAALGLDTTRLGEAFFHAVEDYEAVRPMFNGMLPPDIDGATVMLEAQRLMLGLHRIDMPGLPE